LLSLAGTVSTLLRTARRPTAPRTKAGQLGPWGQWRRSLFVTTRSWVPAARAAW
jgi:hypothetical protein